MSVVFPVKISSNGRYLVDQNNQPFRIHADTAWEASVDVTLAQWKTYLDDRKSKGFNTVIVQATNPVRYVAASGAPYSVGAGGALPFVKNISGGNWDGDPSFANDLGANNPAPGNFDADFSTPNSTYWSWIDTLLTEASSRQILVVLTYNYLGFNNGAQDGWWKTLINTGNTQSVCTGFGNFLGNRYKTFDNIIWDAGVDMFPTGGSEGETRHHKILEGIQAVGDTHLVTGHWKASSLSTDEANFSALMTVNSVYAHGTNQFPQVHARARLGYSHTPPIPAFLKETGYEGSSAYTRKQGRFAMWGSALSAIAGTTIGINGLWDFDTNWDTTLLNTSHALDMQRMGLFLNGLQWYNLVPNGLGTIGTIVTAGGGTIQTAGSVGSNDGDDGLDYVCAAATPNGLYLVAYVPDGHTGSVTIDMTKMRKTATARWFDPTNGQFTPIGNFSNSGTHAFTTPGTNAGGDLDWVLFLDIGMVDEKFTGHLNWR